MPTEGRPRSGIRVGNDVIDLDTLRGRHRTPERERRFLERVFSPSERDRLRAAGPDAPRLAWAGWAAKETAFKIHSKLAGRRPVFRHSRYEALLEIEDGDPGHLRGIRGTVTGEGVSAWVTGWTSESFLHLAGAGNSGATAPRRDLLLELGMERLDGIERVDPGVASTSFTPEEAAGIRTPLSARVRTLARRRIESHLARLEARLRELDPRPGSAPAVEIRTDPSDAGRSPPVVWISGQPSPEIDLSLSHHGNCVAWAFLLPRARASAPDGPHLVG